MDINSQKLLGQLDSFIVKSIIAKEVNLMLGSLVSFKTLRLGFPPTFPLLSGGLYHDWVSRLGFGNSWETYSQVTYFCGLFLLIDYLGKMFLRFKPILPSSLVSDSRSLLEAFWILSLISLGRLETFTFPC